MGERSLTAELPKRPAPPLSKTPAGEANHGPSTGNRSTNGFRMHAPYYRAHGLHTSSTKPAPIMGPTMALAVIMLL